MGNIVQHEELASGLDSAAGVETGGILVLDKPAGFTSAKSRCQDKEAALTTQNRPYRDP